MTSFQFVRIAAILGLAALMLPGSAFAQAARATLSGTVYDASGAAVPNAKVTVIDTERNISDTRIANEVGRYLFTDLNPGHYELQADAQGFKKSRTTGILLEVSQKFELNPTLELGQTNEQIAVTATAIGLETTSGTVSGVVGSQEVSDLPLNARDFYSLLQLVPNVRA